MSSQYQLYLHFYWNTRQYKEIEGIQRRFIGPYDYMYISFKYGKLYLNGRYVYTQGTTVDPRQLGFMFDEGLL